MVGFVRALTPANEKEQTAFYKKINFDSEKKAKRPAWRTAGNEISDRMETDRRAPRGNGYSINLLERAHRRMRDVWF
jgi:hypothetical protein